VNGFFIDVIACYDLQVFKPRQFKAATHQQHFTNCNRSNHGRLKLQHTSNISLTATDHGNLKLQHTSNISPTVTDQTTAD